MKHNDTAKHLVSMGKGVDFEHAGHLSDEDNDDDVNISQVSFCGAGSGTIIRSWIRKFVISAVCAIILVVISIIADASCQWSVRAGAPESRCVILKTPLGAWLRFFAFVTIISIVAQILDRIVFAIIATYGNRFNNNALASQVLFFSTSLEGSLDRFIWLGLIYAYFDGVIAKESGVITDEDSFDPVLVERCLQILLAYQTLAVIRNLAVRVISRTFLISSFETRISDVLFGNLVIMCLTAPHPIVDTYGTIYRKQDKAPTTGVPPLPSLPPSNSTGDIAAVGTALGMSSSTFHPTKPSPTPVGQLSHDTLHNFPAYPIYPGQRSSSSSSIHGTCTGAAALTGSAKDSVPKIASAAESGKGTYTDVEASKTSPTSGELYDTMSRRYEVAKAGSEMSVKLFKHAGDLASMLTLGNLLTSENWQHKLDFASTLRMRIFTKDARLVPLTRKEALPKFMKFSYMALSSIPEELLRSPVVAPPTYHGAANTTTTTTAPPLPPLLATDPSDHLSYNDILGLPTDPTTAASTSTSAASDSAPGTATGTAPLPTDTSPTPGTSSAGFSALTRRMRSLSLYRTASKANTALLKSPPGSIDTGSILAHDPADAIALTMASPPSASGGMASTPGTALGTATGLGTGLSVIAEQEDGASQSSPSLLRKATRTLIRTQSQVSSAASAMKQKLGGFARDRSGSNASSNAANTPVPNAVPVTPGSPPLAPNLTPASTVTSSPLFTHTTHAIHPLQYPSATQPSVQPSGASVRPQPKPPTPLLTASAGTGALPGPVSAAAPQGTAVPSASSSTSSPAFSGLPPPPRSRALHANTFVPPDANTEQEQSLRIQVPHRGSLDFSSTTATNSTNSTARNTIRPTIGTPVAAASVTTPTPTLPPGMPPLKRSNSMPRQRGESSFFTKEDAAQVLLPLINTPALPTLSVKDEATTGTGGTTTAATSAYTPTGGAFSATGSDWSGASPKATIDPSLVSNALARVGTMARIERFVRRNSDPQLDLSALHPEVPVGAATSSLPSNTTSTPHIAFDGHVPGVPAIDPLLASRWQSITPFELPISWQTYSDTYCPPPNTEDRLPHASRTTTGTTHNNIHTPVPPIPPLQIPATCASRTTSPTLGNPVSFASTAAVSAMVPPAPWSARSAAAQMLLNGKSLGRLGGMKLRDAFLKTVRTANRSLDGLDKLEADEKEMERRKEAQREKEMEKERDKEKRKDYITRTLRLSHFHTVLDNSLVDPEKAFNLFDKDGDGLCTYEDFLSGALNIYTELVSLKRSLDGHQSVVTAVASVLNVVFWLLLSTIVLWIVEISLLDVYVPVGTLLVSTSFAIGGSVANIVNSLIFILFMRPFDVGDRVTVSNLFHGDEMLLVKRIGVLQTTFVRTVNKEVTFPNWLILQGAIENFKRSPNAAVRLDTVVGFRTTRRQIVELEIRMNKYLSALQNRVNWRPTCFTRILRVSDLGIHLAFWATSHHTWHDMPRVYPAIYALWLELLEVMRDLNIPFQKADQRLLLETLDGDKVFSPNAYDISRNQRDGDRQRPEESTAGSTRRSGAGQTPPSSQWRRSLSRTESAAFSTGSVTSVTPNCSSDANRAQRNRSSADSGMNLLSALTNALQSLAETKSHIKHSKSHSRSNKRRTARFSETPRSSFDYDVDDSQSYESDSSSLYSASLRKRSKRRQEESRGRHPRKHRDRMDRRMDGRRDRDVIERRRHGVTGSDGTMGRVTANRDAGLGGTGTSDELSSLGLDLFRVDSETPSVIGPTSGRDTASNDDSDSSGYHLEGIANRKGTQNPMGPLHALDKLPKQQLTRLLLQQQRQQESNRENNLLALLLQQQQQAQSDGQGRKQRVKQTDKRRPRDVGNPTLSRHLNGEGSGKPPIMIHPREMHLPLSSTLSQESLQKFSMASYRNFSKNSLDFSSSEDEASSHYQPNSVDFTSSRVAAHQSFPPVDTALTAQGNRDPPVVPIPHNHASDASLQSANSGLVGVPLSTQSTPASVLETSDSLSAHPLQAHPLQHHPSFSKLISLYQQNTFDPFTTENVHTKKRSDSTSAQGMASDTSAGDSGAETVTNLQSLGV